MNKIDILLQAFKENPSTEVLRSLLNTINTLLLNIKMCDTVGESNTYFDLLQKIQENICGPFFRDEVVFNDELAKFVRDCDRLDDPWLREYLFEKIKKGEYSL